MATETLHEWKPLEYLPNKTLGRSGYVACPSDRMSQNIERLDALLLFMCNVDDDGDASFQLVNEEIQHSLLQLASGLATEIHELSSELVISQVNKSMCKQ